MENTNDESQKYYKRIIEVSNWKISLTRKGKSVKWDGTMTEETCDEIIEFLFQKHGKVEEYKHPPTYIIEPKPIQPEP